MMPSDRRAGILDMTWQSRRCAQTGVMSIASQPDPRPRPPLPARDWALFLDVDGCLLEFAASPDKVVVPPRLLACLRRLSTWLDGSLALVSGRSVDTLDALFAPVQLPCAGLHGLQRRNRDGAIVMPVAPPMLRTVAADARALAASRPGVVAEDKGISLALHWRAAPQAEPVLRAFAQTALRRLPDYRLQSGDHVVELRPIGSDKGDAITAFLDEPPFHGRMPVFAGDDLTDEHGFAVVNARGGFSILVGEREPSAACFALRDPAQVLDWLDAAPAPDAGETGRG